MYDYFVDPVHIAYCIETAKEFTALHLRPNNISLAGKSVLDISGGNGHFIVEIARKEGARPALTEINEPAMAYARNTHGIPVYKFNFQQHRLKDVVADKFDVIMARAAIMFCADLDQFAADANDRLNHGGLMFINHSVIPTLGVAIRVQLDEFSYVVLRQPENVVKIFEKNGFEVVKNAPDPDFFMYVYDHDLNGWWQFAQNLYTIPAVRTLLAAERAGKPSYTFRARDRRRATMIFRKP
ncbi:MAG: class I SAM-dependent methyltransferase [Rhizomicrobium sp.]